MSRRVVSKHQTTQQTGLLRLIAAAQANLNLTTQDYADALGVTYNTWYHRRHKLDSLTLGELRELRKLTGFSKEQIMEALDI